MATYFKYMTASLIQVVWFFIILHKIYRNELTATILESLASLFSVVERVLPIEEQNDDRIRELSEAALEASRSILLNHPVEAEEAASKAMDILVKTPTEPKSTIAYVCKVARNQAYNLLKKLKAYAGGRDTKSLDLTRETELSSDAKNGEDMLIQSETPVLTNEVLFAAIGQLPKQHRKIFELKYLDGYTYKEIADECNLNEKQVEYKLSTARNMLKGELEAYRETLT